MEFIDKKNLLAVIQREEGIMVLGKVTLFKEMQW